MLDESPSPGGRVFRPEWDGVEYTKLESVFGKLSAEEIDRYEIVSTMHYFAFHILDTFEKIDLTLDLIDSINFEVDIEEKVKQFEYYVENYYIRVPTVLEQLYVVINNLLTLGYNFRKPPKGI